MKCAWAIALLLICSLASANYVIPADTPHKNDLSISQGNLKYQGITILSRDEAKVLASDKAGVSIYINAPGKVRSYDVAANNGLLRVTDSGSYLLSGKRWNTRDPQLKFVLKTDTYLAGEGLAAGKVQSAIYNATQTWDDASNQNLFADTGLITVSSTIATDSYNKVNTINWKPFLNRCIAYSRSWYKSALLDGYKTTVDSDLVFNTNYAWRTEGTVGADVETIALHELGHTLGLGDLYASADLGQAMYGYYLKVTRSLGTGDQAGITKLYG
ncbi:matrixin family metalloprotease [Candidatus Pacearchaeota archaeon]|nr:matrixin family metalloprotease [Candidatus Pacearchaeota archaeon]